MSPSIAIGFSHPSADKQQVPSELDEHPTQTVVNGVVTVK